MFQSMPVHAHGVSDHTHVRGPSDGFVGAPYHNNASFHLRNGPQPRQPQPTRWLSQDGSTELPVRSESPTPMSQNTMDYVGFDVSRYLVLLTHTTHIA
jgi:hypothetical protein